MDRAGLTDLTGWMCGMTHCSPQARCRASRRSARGGWLWWRQTARGWGCGPPLARSLRLDSSEVSLHHPVT